MKKIPLLTPDDIEVKIKQCMKGGAVALLYKTARVDYRILDEVYGQYNWQIDYQEIKGNLYCTISLWDEEKKQWIRKTNCGIESREDGEGNEKKGEASDAAKRAGTVVGIGAELYSAPFIFMEVATEEDNKGKYKLKDSRARYVVTDIKYDDSRVITGLTIANEKTGVVVFEWTGKKSSKSKTPKETKEEAKEDTVEEKAPKAKPAKAEKKAPEAPKTKTEVDPVPTEEKAASDAKMPLNDLIRNIGLIAKKLSNKEGDLTPYLEVVKEVTGDPAFKCSKATEDQYDILLKIYQALVQKGYDN